MASYDFRKTADTFQWYVVDDRPKRVLYGPYPSKEDAQVAQLLTLNFAKIDAAMKAKGSWWKRDLKNYQDGPVWYSVGSFYEADLEVLRNDPEAIGYKSAAFKAPKALKVHPSWKSRPYGVAPEKAALYLVTSDKQHIGLA